MRIEFIILALLWTVWEIRIRIDFSNRGRADIIKCHNEVILGSKLSPLINRQTLLTSSLVSYYENAHAFPSQSKVCLCKEEGFLKVHISRARN